MGQRKDCVIFFEPGHGLLWDRLLRRTFVLSVNCRALINNPVALRLQYIQKNHFLNFVINEQSFCITGTKRKGSTHALYRTIAPEKVMVYPASSKKEKEKKIQKIINVDCSFDRVDRSLTKNETSTTAQKINISATAGI